MVWEYEFTYEVLPMHTYGIQKLGIWVNCNSFAVARELMSLRI